MANVKPVPNYVGAWLRHYIFQSKLFIVQPAIYHPSPRNLPSRNRPITYITLSPPKTSKKRSNTLNSCDCRKKTKPAVKNPLESLARLKPVNQLRFLLYLHLLHLTEHPILFSLPRRPLPSPVLFSLRAVLFSFALLFIMPTHPLTMPAALGLGISLALLTHTSRRLVVAI